MNTQQQLLKTALKLARSGYYIYPLSLYRGSDGKKKPDVRVAWREESTRDETTIRDWFTVRRMGMTGIGIDCGKSGIIVVDLDVSAEKHGDDNWNAFPWSCTSDFTATSVNGGKHMFFRDGGRAIKTTAGVVADDVDIRSDGGTIFCEPTEFEGRRYKFDGPIVKVEDLPELPEETREGILEQYAAAPGVVGSKPTALPEGIIVSESRAVEMVETARWKFEQQPDWNTIFGYAVQAMKLELGKAARDGREVHRELVTYTIEQDILKYGPWDSLNEDDLKHIQNGVKKAERDPWVILADEDVAADIDPRAPLLDLFGVKAPEMPGDPYQNQAAAATAVVDILADRFLYAPGIGWLEWNGSEWATGDKMLGTPLHDVRMSVIGAIKRADRLLVGVSRNKEFRGYQARLQELKNQRGDKAAGEEEQKIERDLHKIESWREAWLKYKKWWEKLGSRRHLEDVLKFVERDPGRIRILATSLDGDAHLLNCANGTVDLRTGELRPHEPTDYITKNTNVRYNPAATSEFWDKARQAFAPGIEDWLQRKAGEGAFGMPPRDDTLLFSFGQGSNGKSTLTDALTHALGDYCVTLHDKAVMGNEHDHGTEKMVFRGARWTVLEELPEGRALNPVTIKKLVGTGQITARAMRQDNVTFSATHHILISANHRPQVYESDHGTWRRLVAIPWPYSFRRPDEAFRSEYDRPMDTEVKPAMKTDTRTKEAVLAWIVAGAVAFWQNGRSCGDHPEEVRKYTQMWKDEADVFGAFFADNLKADPGSFVSSKELLEEFNEYLRDLGKRPVSEGYVSSRLGNMPECPNVEQTRIRTTSKLLTVSTRGPMPGSKNPIRGFAGIRWT